MGGGRPGSPFRNPAFPEQNRLPSCQPLYDVEKFSSPSYPFDIGGDNMGPGIGLEIPEQFQFGNVAGIAVAHRLAEPNPIAPELTRKLRG